VAQDSFVVQSVENTEIECGRSDTTARHGDTERWRRSNVAMVELPFGDVCFSGFWFRSRAVAATSRTVQSIRPAPEWWTRWHWWLWAVAVCRLLVERVACRRCCNNSGSLAITSHRQPFPPNRRICLTRELPVEHSKTLQFPLLASRASARHSDAGTREKIGVMSSGLALSGGGHRRPLSPFARRLLRWEAVSYLGALGVSVKAIRNDGRKKNFLRIALI
jgi:hypothetical protein